MDLITRQTADAVSAEVETAVAAIFAAHGLAALKIKVGYGDFLRITLESSPKMEGKNGVNLASPEALAYERYHEDYDLPANGLGARFVFNGKDLILTGLHPSRPKFPVAAFCPADGQTYKLTASVARHVRLALAGDLQ